MTDRILENVKQMLGLAPDYTPFDPELVMHINSVFLVLNQLGVGKEGFELTLTQDYNDQMTSEQTWSQFLDGAENMNAVKSYVYTKVKMLFDPPANGTLMSSLQALADEFEFRLETQADHNRIGG